VRIRTSEAVKFEHIAKMTAAQSGESEQPAERPVRRNSRTS
jgi:hypothetical protein